MNEKEEFEQIKAALEAAGVSGSIEPEIKYGGLVAVTVHESRCEIRLHQEWHGGWSARREENEILWDVGSADTPEEAVLALGPEPEPNTVEGVTTFMQSHEGSVPLGPLPHCPKCGSKLTRVEPHGHWHVEFGLACHQCGWAWEGCESAAYDAWAKKQQGPWPHDDACTIGEALQHACDP